MRSLPLRPLYPPQDDDTTVLSVIALELSGEIFALPG